MGRIYKIENGAIFIGDAHTNANRPQFRAFLEELKKVGEYPRQIFMLGDMFDFLANTDYSQKFYEYEINLLNEISKECEIFYFEGNHDFNLSEIFPLVKVFPNSIQPVSFKSEFDEILQVSHGDIFLPKKTQIALLFLRNKFFLKIANFIDKLIDFEISKYILKRQAEKNLGRKIENFQEIISQRIRHYKAKFIIEGHYHQDLSFEFGKQKYLNLNSFALSPKIYKFNTKSNKFDEFFVNLNLK